MKSKKILIISIVVFIIIIAGCILLKSNNKKIEIATSIPEQIENIEQISGEEDIIKNEVEDEILQSDTSDSDISEEITKQEEQAPKEPVVVKQEVSNKKQEENKQILVQNTVKKDIEEIKKQETKTESIVIENKVETAVIEEVKPTITETPKQQTVETEVKKETTKDKNTQQERVVTTKINNEYINKIKNYLKTHESDLMKQYGYEIVVDSNIINLTNGFTFSDLNMSAYTKTSVGIIRIYAEDYYVNGEFGQTLCYVL